MKISMNAKFIIGLSCIILFSCSITGFLSYRTHLQLFEEEVSEQYGKANEQAMSTLDLRIQEIYRISNSIVFNSVIEKVVTNLMTKRDNLFDNYLEHEELQSLLRQIKLDEPYIQSVYFYDLNGVNYYFGHMNEKIGQLEPAIFEDVLRNVEQSNGQLIWLKREIVSPFNENEKTDFIIASRWMKNNRSLERYGLLVMVIDERLFAKTLYDLTKGTDSQVYLFEQRNQLLYSDDDESLLPDMPVLSSSVFVRKEEKGGFLYAVNHSTANQFTLISRASLESFQSKSKVLLNISLVSGLAAIVMSGVLIVLFSTSDQLLQWAEELAKQFIACFQTWQANMNNNVIDKTLNYIEQNYMETCGLSTVAEMFHMSVTYFSKLFKKETGETYTNYLTKVRMEKAKLLLCNTDMKMFEIASAVGFNDPNYFTNVFNRTQNVSPTEFRRLHQ
ncbi:AraC family transcriptional regulator [Paenibacillus sp. IITD108]|uniref:AraC family transcriptional regulator n=1 Tax=Paenibacillus sp. IITD108 TaxID=3116649 RepID=UPI002F40482C